MAVEVILTSDRFESDPAGRELLDAISDTSLDGLLQQSVYYYDFPSYSDYDVAVHTPSGLLLSPRLGILAVRAISEFELASGNYGSLVEVEEEISQFCSILIGRLLKSRVLRTGVSRLSFDVTPVIYAPGFADIVDREEVDCDVITSKDALVSYLESASSSVVLNGAQLLEARSVIEGAKALVRPTKRVVENPSVQRAAAALVKLESEIANFDQKQRRAALSTVPGPQRIRGLAGSGKTVILAMKVAHLHLTNPKANILITFFTKSLNDTIRSLITKFYRHYRDLDPDWSMVHVRHGWGGANKAGVYADACRRAGVPPLTLTEARGIAKAGVEPFDAACQHLLGSAAVDSFYDYVLIDEGQDFPSSFYRLAYSIARGGRDRKNIVWAYDELQNILDVKIRSPEELFGPDEKGQPLMSLDRSSRGLPRGAQNDILLSKCYRNQREILVVAHALGFGIYNETVQMLESAEHWEDVGYKVVSGDLTEVGSDIVIERPVENSPVSLEGVPGFPLIETHLARDFDGECHWAAEKVNELIVGGLNPHDVILISLDDREARSSFRQISQKLAGLRINSHNLLADPYSDPPFFVEGHVTLSTIYRAKGNEAPAVIVVGLDGAGRRTRQGRNKVFTAFTRSKAWLRVSGMGSIAKGLIEEISIATANFPQLKFKMPDLRQVEFIQRDLSQKQAQLKKIRDKYLTALREQGFTEEEANDLLQEDVGGPSRSGR